MTQANTSLSRHIGDLKEQNISYRLDWKDMKETAWLPISTSRWRVALCYLHRIDAAKVWLENNIKLQGFTKVKERRYKVMKIKREQYQTSRFDKIFWISFWISNFKDCQNNFEFLLLAVTKWISASWQALYSSHHPGWHIRSS